MVITKTPYRLSLFGGGTDFHDWYEANPSSVIVAAMDHYCYISVKKQPNFFDYKSRVAYSKIELVKSNHEIKHPSVRECLKYFNFDSGLDIHHVGELPAQSGIGSSSSFTVGLLSAIHALKGNKPTKAQLAEEAIYVEQEMIKEAVGVQDQISAAYGGINIIKVGPKKKMKIQKLNVSFGYKEYLRRSILLGFTGITRDGIALMETHKKNIKAGKSVKLLQEINSITLEALEMIKMEGDIENLGNLLKNAWNVKKQFSTKTENKNFEEIYEVANANGALGGKLMGAGGQGFFYFLAHPNKHEKIKKALPGVRVWVPFNFSKYGSRSISYSGRLTNFP